jgi:hypothetical protein
MAKTWKFLLVGVVIVFLVFLFYTPGFFKDPYTLLDFFNRRAVYSGFSDESGVEIFFFVPNFVGPIITFFAAAGAYICLINKNKRSSIILLMFVANLSWVLTYYYCNFSLFVPYRRALLYVTQMLYLLAAVGLLGITKFTYDTIRHKHSNKIIFFIIAFVMISTVITYQTATSVKFTKFFYTEISNGDYDNLMFFKNVDEDITIMCLPQVCHTIFPITGQHVVSTMMVMGERSRDSNLFFESNCTVMEEISKKYDVSYVYSGKPLNCSFIKLVSENVYETI